ncbi:MAG: Rrf2 family transcriptional regulator [Planctomycetaceae bacterium]|nr:Rrf2 family transcriptional regulator [Planctomycetaceae bacterium]
MFSQTVEYALRAVVQLAYKAPEPCTTEQIAEATMVPKAYLSKVLQGLSRAGIVNSQRGIRGGMSLSKSPDELTILDVVNSVDPIQRIHQCPLGLKSHGANLCPLHRRMDESLATVEKAFASTTLAEILAEPNNSAPLCERVDQNPYVNLTTPRSPEN